MSLPRIKKKSPEIKRLKRKYFRQYNLLLGSRGWGDNETDASCGLERKMYRATGFSNRRSKEIEKKYGLSEA